MINLFLLKHPNRVLETPETVDHFVPLKTKFWHTTVTTYTFLINKQFIRECKNLFKNWIENVSFKLVIIHNFGEVDCLTTTVY